MDLGFLSNVVLNADASAPRRPKKERMPVNAHLRIFKNGAVYPSQELIDLLGLEYVPQTQDAEGKWKEPENPGNGFDVCLSSDFPAFSSPVPVIVIATVSRIHSKISLFGSVSYVKEADAERKLGEPLVTVGQQGSTTFGAEELLPMLAEIYGVVPGPEGYMDLNLVGKDAQPGVTNPWVFDRPVYVPKKVARGELKGQASTVRRENSKYFVLVPVEGTTSPVGTTLAPETEEEGADDQVGTTQPAVSA